MTILAIETSCDETGVAVLKKKNDSIEVVADELASQVEFHREYGGIYPTVAKREHKKNLPLLFKKAMEKTNRTELKAIAVTVGPGLEPCLWQGVNFAQKLAKDLNLPVIPVDHMEAHLLAGLAGENSDFQIPNPKNTLPAVTLLVSGGHTQLVLMKKIGDYKVLGETRDDAAGECFDKTARLLGLPYPGGPAIAAEAAKFSNVKKQREIELPRPMQNSGDYDFSFSGLKTAVLYKTRETPSQIRESEKFVRAMAHEIQAAITEVLVKKTVKAVKHQKAKSIILGGGVSANKKLRQQFRNQARKLGIKLMLPAKELSTDNAVMVGITGLIHREKATGWKNIKADAKLRIDKI